MFREMFSSLKSRGIYSDVSTERLFRARLYFAPVRLSSQGGTRKSMIFSKRILGDPEGFFFLTEHYIFQVF
jgi:hypothetical protein